MRYTAEKSDPVGHAELRGELAQAGLLGAGAGDH